jgi:hypothetical protein
MTDTAERVASLRDLVREVIAENPDATVQEIAEYVAKLTPEENLMDFFIEALVRIVDEILGAQRRTALDKVSKGNKSAKLERRRKWWADLLASRVHVGDELKRLGNCTVDDLQLCVDERRNHIRLVEGQIMNYEKLMQMMVKHGARTVEELPEQDKWEDAA